MQINLIEYLEATSNKFPEQIAVEDRNSTITFKNLRNQALNLSAKILHKISANNSPIGIFLPKSIDAVCSFAAVLYSGNFYIPLDIKTPIERLASIINNINPSLIITNRLYAPILRNLTLRSNLLVIGDDTNSSEILTGINHRIDTDPAYLINTSGSTGTPKGVIVSHRSVIDYIDWAVQTYPVNQDTIIGSQAPFYFDNSVLDIYLCFAAGAKLVLIPEECFAFPIKLLEFLQDKQINHIFWVPSVLANISKLDLLSKLKPLLKNILFAGEVMPAPVLNYWRMHYPQALFCNLYGPTEITVDCTYYILGREIQNDESVPIGKPCRNSDILVLDEKNRLVVKPDISGELCVRGSSLALGYYNDLKSTEEVFIQNPLHQHYPEKIYRTGDMVHYNQYQELVFEGRRDLQIKHFGYRIELGEIETALGIISDLPHKCVIHNPLDDTLILFYESNTELNFLDLVQNLNNRLPKYMIPTVLRRLNKFPLTSNGKIDRKLLQKMIGI